MPKEMVEIQVPKLEFKTEYAREDLMDFMLDFENILEQFMELKELEKKQKNKVLQIRVTESEKQEIKKKSEAEGVNVSTFIRERVLS